MNIFTHEFKLPAIFDNFFFDLFSSLFVGVSICIIVYAFFVLDPRDDLGRDPDFHQQVEAAMKKTRHHYKNLDEPF